ncbi:MAG: hypothetical protein ACP5U0_08325, partial [Caldisphaera sp.]
RTIRRHRDEDRHNRGAAHRGAAIEERRHNGKLQAHHLEQAPMSKYTEEAAMKTTLIYSGGI